jgi:outer membrane protein OmpA-like peptidoglycan-associated protein
MSMPQLPEPPRDSARVHDSDRASRGARALLGLAAAGALLLAGAPASAQQATSSVRIDQFQPASAGSPFGRAEGPHEEFDKGLAYAFRLNGDYAFQPIRSQVIVGDTESDSIAVVEHALITHVGASLSPLYWLNFEVNLPFAPWVTGEDDRRVTATPVGAGDGVGMGDLRVGAFARPVTGEELDLAFGARVWVPFGAEGNTRISSSGDVRIEAVASTAGEIDFLVYGCTLGIAPLFFGGRDGDRLAASCAAHFKVHPMVSLGVEPHVALFSYKPKFNEDVFPGLGNADFALQFEPMGALQFNAGPVGVSLMGGPGLGGAPGMGTARGVLMVSYSARGEREVKVVVADADLDGIPDEDDKCPKSAGAKERDGCPDPRDTDGDGIVEGDACPDKPGANYDDPKANGCPDRDNDHVADPVDPCPIEPGADSDGCPKHARLKDGQFVLTPEIMFGKRSSKLAAEEVLVLRDIIRTMRANPKMELVSIAVGSKKTALKLTDARAKAIHDVFSEQNFDSSRYEVVLNDELDGGKVTVRLVQ